MYTHVPIHFESIVQCYGLLLFLLFWFVTNLYRICRLFFRCVTFEHMRSVALFRSPSRPICGCINLKVYCWINDNITRYLIIDYMTCLWMTIALLFVATATESFVFDIHWPQTRMVIVTNQNANISIPIPNHQPNERMKQERHIYGMLLFSMTFYSPWFIGEWKSVFVIIQKTFRIRTYPHIQWHTLVHTHTHAHTINPHIFWVLLHERARVSFMRSFDILINSLHRASEWASFGINELKRASFKIDDLLPSNAINSVRSVELALSIVVRFSFPFYFPIQCRFSHFTCSCTTACFTNGRMKSRHIVKIRLNFQAVDWVLSLTWFIANVKCVCCVS